MVNKHWLSSFLTSNTVNHFHKILDTLGLSGQPTDPSALRIPPPSLFRQILDFPHGHIISPLKPSPVPSLMMLATMSVVMPRCLS
jgi:hypothetical protein